LAPELARRIRERFPAEYDPDPAFTIIHFNDVVVRGFGDIQTVPSLHARGRWKARYTFTT